MVRSTRRRKILTTEVEQANVIPELAEEAIDMVNQNNNHETSENKRCKLTGNLTKAQKQEPDRAHTSQSTTPKAGRQAIVFDEDDNEMQMEVSTQDSEFLSDGELDSHHDEESQDWLQSEVSQSENKESSQSSSDSQSDDGEETGFASGRSARSTPTKVKAKKQSRHSMEAKLDSMTHTLHEMQQLMKDSGLLNLKRQSDPGSRGKEPRKIVMVDSVTMIYESAVLLQQELQICKVDKEVTFNFKRTRDNLSSDDAIDTSDEMVDPDSFGHLNISDLSPKDWQDRPQGRRDHRALPVVRPGPNNLMIHEVEAAKARMIPTSGNSYILDAGVGQGTGPSDHLSMHVDEQYRLMGTHIDQTLKAKILNFENMDFARLLPKDRISKEDDHRMELVSEGMSTFFVLVSDHETLGITSFWRWEQAFCIYSNILTSTFPQKSPELLQYNQVIFSAAQTYAWENVYTYDCEFRWHISNFLCRSWAMILQQAWALYFKDRIDKNRVDFSTPKNGGHKKEICRRFNKGLCKNGINCRYDHQCDVPSCGKFGHGAHICRKKTQMDRTDKTETVTGNQGLAAKH